MMRWLRLRASIAYAGVTIRDPCGGSGGIIPQIPMQRLSISAISAASRGSEERLLVWKLTGNSGSYAGQDTMTTTRRGPGQPRKLAEPVKLSVMLDRADLDRLDRWCKRLRIKRSEAVRRLVRTSLAPCQMPAYKMLTEAAVDAAKGVEGE